MVAGVGGEMGGGIKGEGGRVDYLVSNVLY